MNSILSVLRRKVYFYLFIFEHASSPRSILNDGLTLWTVGELLLKITSSKGVWMLRFWMHLFTSASMFCPVFSFVLSACWGPSPHGSFLCQKTILSSSIHPAVKTSSSSIFYSDITGAFLKKFIDFPLEALTLFRLALSLHRERLNEDAMWSQVLNRWSVE